MFVPLAPPLSKIKTISDQLLVWMEKQGFCGWDPHDALNSPFLRPLSRIHRWVGIALLQLVKECPINLRPMLLVPNRPNAKAFGL